MRKESEREGERKNEESEREKRDYDFKEKLSSLPSSSFKNLPVKKKPPGQEGWNEREKKEEEKEG